MVSVVLIVASLTGIACLIGIARPESASATTTSPLALEWNVWGNKARWWRSVDCEPA
jgi:hypothetical protein